MKFYRVMFGNIGDMDISLPTNEFLTPTIDGAFKKWRENVSSNDFCQVEQVTLSDNKQFFAYKKIDANNHWTHMGWDEAVLLLGDKQEYGAGGDTSLGFQSISIKKSNDGTIIFVEEEIEGEPTNSYTLAPLRFGVIYDNGSGYKEWGNNEPTIETALESAYPFPGCNNAPWEIQDSEGRIYCFDINQVKEYIPKKSECAPNQGAIA